MNSYTYNRVARFQVIIDKSTIASSTLMFQPRATADPHLATIFYRDLKRAYDVRYKVYFGGDFNAKLGKMTEEELASDVSRHVAVGTRNSNGERLLNLLYTRTGWLKDKTTSKPHATKPVSDKDQL